MELTFSRRLKLLRLHKKDVAEALGVSSTQVSRWADTPPQYALIYLQQVEQLRCLQQLLDTLQRKGDG